MKRYYIGVIILSLLLLSGCDNSIERIILNEVETKSFDISNLYDGNTYSVKNYTSNLASGEDINILINVSSPILLDEAVAVATASPHRITLHEDINYSNRGNKIIARNNNRNLDNGITTEFYYGTIVEDRGVLIDSDIITGDRKEGGVTLRNDIPYILRENETYLLTVENQANSDSQTSISIVFTE